ncbi:hypothetical protein AMTR_s00060p00138350 [Amborella trichopoda]|uniref:DUF4283 domain-containing protein n=1 Tax=Amborella trichopoda TaxID=13333 RepID=W1NKW0_AMBTC|nr:hypothetical protein AMTR_s00060p00138350 [Amborella trichopoda]
MQCITRQSRGNLKSQLSGFANTKPPPLRPVYHNYVHLINLNSLLTSLPIPGSSGPQPSHQPCPYPTPQAHAQLFKPSSTQNPNRASSLGLTPTSCSSPSTRFSPCPPLLLGSKLITLEGPFILDMKKKLLSSLIGKFHPQRDDIRGIKAWGQGNWAELDLSYWKLFNGWVLFSFSLEGGALTALDRAPLPISLSSLFSCSPLSPLTPCSPSLRIGPTQPPSRLTYGFQVL